MFASVGSWTPKLTTITAAQMTAINANMQNAWDIIGGLTYTPVVQSVLTGTVGLKFNFSATGLQIAGLGGLHILSGSTGYVDSGGFLTVSSGGIATIANGASLNLANGSEEVVQSGAILNVASGGTLNISTGGFLTCGVGSTTALQGTTTVSGALGVDATGTITTNAASTTTLNGPLAQVGTVTRTGLSILSGSGATTRRRFTKKGVLAANDTVDLTADVFSFSDPSADIDVSINYASGGDGFEIECFSTAVSAVKFIQFKFSGSNIAKFPAGATSAWVKFVYDGLLWYVSAYGGGTTV